MDKTIIFLIWIHLLFCSLKIIKNGFIAIPVESLSGKQISPKGFCYCSVNATNVSGEYEKYGWCAYKDEVILFFKPSSDILAELFACIIPVLFLH
jgi:hypothetical protein